MFFSVYCHYQFYIVLNDLTSIKVSYDVMDKRSNDQLDSDND